jgi:hypothetical protein
MSDGGGEPMASNFGVVTEPSNPEALSLDPSESPPGYNDEASKEQQHTSVVVRLLKRADVVLVLLLVMGLIGVVVANVRHKSQNPVANNATQDYDTVKLPLTGFITNNQGVSIGASSVAINGSLKVNDGLIVAPSVQPNAPTAGQLYYDQNTNQLAYYNGTGFVPLTAQSQPQVVQTLGGLSGNITLGAGLTTVGNQIVSINNGVTSLGGQTGAIALGSGLKLTANGLQNAGVLSVAAGSNISVTNDGNGNYTVTNTGSGTGTVTSSGSTAGSIAMFDSAQNITDSLISQSGAQVTITGDLNVVTGGLSLGNALTVSNGGTGVNSLADNGVVVSHGTGSFTAVTTGSPGLCLMSTAGAPTFAACPGNSGVTSLNGISGVLTIANASASGGTVTIDDATTGGGKGIASFNSTNFTASAGVINTIQDISTSASPTFGRLTVSSGQAANPMLLVNNTNLAATGNLLDLQLGGSSKFSVQPGGNVTATGTINGQTISSSASFTGTLGVTGNTTLSGTLNVNGGTIGATGNLAVTPAGSLTAGSSTQTLALQGNSSSTIAISNGGNTTTVSFQAPGANVTYRVPTAAAGSYDICTTAGNCVGSGGGVTTTGGTTNRISKFTGAQSVGDSSISDNGTLVSTTANIAIQGGTATVGVANSQTGTLTLAYGAGNFSGSLTVGTLTASRTYTLPDADGTVCLSSGNCLGGGGGGANTALSNLNSVAINTSLLPGTTSIDLGSTSAPFRNLFISGSSLSPNTNNFQITGTATGARTITLPDSSGTVCLNNSTNCGFLTGTGTAFVQNGNSFGATGVLGTTDANALQIITGNVARLTLGASGGATFANDVAINGSTLSSAAALNITPGGTLTVGATNQALTLQGSASTTVSATGGGFTTTVGFTGSPTGAVNYNFDRAATPGTYNICTTAGNCSGSGGGVTTPGGTNNRVAKFTGSQTLGDSSLSDNGTLVSTTGNLTVQGGTATIGVANSQTGILSLAWGSANFSGSLTQGTLTASRTYTLPDADGTVCLSSGNCLGGGGGGANTSLSNLTSVAINTSLLPGGTTVDLGSSTAPFRNLYLAGSSASPASNNFTITGTATGARTITLPDASGTVCLNNSVSCGFATGSGSAYVQNGNTFGGTAVLGTNDNNGLNLRTNGNTALALDTSGNGTLTGNLTINGTTLSSAGALNITPGSTLTVGATAQTLTLQGNASSTLAVTGGGFTTTVGFSGSPTAAVNYNFDRAVAAGTYTICSSIGNCAGSGSGVTTPGGTNGTIAMFTGTQAIGNSLLSQSGGTVAVNGNLNLTSGNNYQINGSQITSANLSNDANLAKLSASQTFSGATLSFQNSGSNSANAFNIQNTGGNALFTANTTAGTIILGTSGTLDGKLVFSNVTNSNTTTIAPGTPTATRTITLPDASGVVCLDSGNCAGSGATLQTAYNFSAGGTVPKIKLNSTLAGMDIQDADTTIGVDLLDVRASNGSGLGAVLFGVGNTGQITMKNSSNSATALSVLTQGGTRVLSVDTSAGAVVLGQGGTLAGTLVLNNATNANKGTVITSALGQDTIYTLPDPVAGSATICLNTGNCLGGGGGANSALSNLSAVAINTTLLPGSAGAINLGSGTLPFGKLFLAGTSSTPGTNNFQITGVATAARTITLPDASGTVCLAGTAACGFATGTGAAFVNNGNAFGAAAVLGTTDGNSLTLQTSSTNRLTIAANGSSIQLGSNTDLIMQGATAYISNTQGQTRGESFGDGAVAAGDAVALGYNASGFFQSVALGSTASNNSTGGVAVGYGAQSGYLAVALGSTSNAAQESVAIGSAASNAAHNSIAIGTNANTTHLNSIALGHDASDTADNQFVVGADNFEITEMYVGSGVVDATPSSFVLQGTGGAGLDASGANVTIAGGKSTGTAAGGNLNFAVSARAGGSNSTLNALTTVATFSGSNGSFQLQNTANSAAAFKIVNAANSETLLTVDTTSRSGSGGNLVKIGNSTGTDAALTILQLDSATAAPTSNLAALNGGLFYNSTTNKVSLVENGAVKIICNTTDLGCGTGTVTLQSSYTNSTGGTTPEILLDSTRNGLDIQDANSTIGASQALLAVRGSATATTLGSAYLQVVGDGRVGVGSIASGVQLNVAGASAMTALKVTGGNNTGTSAGGDGIQSTGGNGGNTTAGGVTSGFGGNNSLVAGNGGTATGSGSYGGWGGATTLTSGNGGASSLWHGGDGGAVTITSGNGGASTASVSNYAGNGGAISLQAGNGAESGGVNTGGTGGNISLTAGMAGFGSTGGSILLSSAGASFAGNYGNISLFAGSGSVQATANSATAFVIQNVSSSDILFTANSNTRTSGVAGNVLKVGNSTGTDTALTVLQLDSVTANPTTNLASLNGGLFYNSTTNKVSLIENGQIKVICNTVDLGCGTGTVTLQNAYTNSLGGTTSEIILDSTRNGLDIQDRSTSNGGTIGANLLTVRATAATDSTAGAIMLSVGNTGATLFKNSSDQNNAFQIQNTSNVALFSVSTLAGTGSSVQLYAPNANNTISTEGIWLRAPKNAVTTLFGNNDSVASYTVNDSSANLRFNGSGVAWGDMGYYPQGGGDGNYGQFRFSTAGSTINTTPNAKVGVGDLYVGGKLGIGTTSPITQLHVAGLLPSGSAQSLALGIDLPYDIEVRGKYLYAAVSSKLRIFDITRPTAMASIGSVATGSGVATLAVSGHYAYVSANSGTMYAIDISNPASPTVTATTTVSSITALTVQGRYLYAATSDSANNIKVYDLANPASPTLVASLPEASAAGFLTAEGRYLYTTLAASGALAVIDISNPAAPANVSTSLVLGASYQVRAVQGRYAYAVSGSNMKVVDISNPASPSTSSTTATGSGSTDVAIQGRYAYIALDSSGNGIQVMDISNPASPSSIGTVPAGAAIRSVVPNGRYIYAANYGNTTLDSYDMGGAYIQQLEVGGIQASTISSDGKLVVGGDGYVQGSLNIGRDATVNGNLGVTGAANIQSTTDSANAFSVKNTAGLLQMNLNTASQANEITNGDIETNTTNGWSVRGTADQLQTANTPVKFGRYSIHVRTLGAANNGIQYSVALKPSTQYSLSLWARRDNSSAASFNMGRADNGSDTDCLTNQTITTTYTQFTCTFTTGATVGSLSNIYFKQTDTSTDEVYIDGATLTQSSSVLNYQTPSSGLEVGTYYNNVSINGATANPELQPWQLNANSITTNGTTAANRSRAGSIAYNGYMYVIGGGTGVDGNGVAATNNSLYAKINADGSVGAFAATTNLNTAVSAANAVVINGYMYMVGGKTADNVTTGIATVQYAKVNSDGTLGTWSTTTTGMPAARSSAGVATYNSYLYVTGGQDNAGGGGTNSYYYAKVGADGNITSWSSGTLPSSPSAHGTFINNGYIYTVGSDLFNTTVYNYAPVLASGAAGTWTSVANMPSTGIGDAGFTTMNGYAYILGGWNGTALVNTVYYAPFNVDGTLGSWTQSINNLPRNVENNTAFTYNGYMYSAGGDISGGTVTPTIYYASGPRTRIAGSLDLTAGSAKNLGDTDGGGTLTAGDTNIVGSLQVQGNAGFKQSVSIGANLSVGGDINSTNINATGNINGATVTGMGLTDCDAQNSKLIYDSTTKQFSCATDRASVSIRKDADVSRANTTTAVADTVGAGTKALLFPVVAGDTYIFQFNINASFGATGQFKYGVSAPAGATCNVSSHGMDSTGGSAELINAACGATGVFQGNDTSYTTVITGTVVNPTNSGNVSLIWAQNTSNGTNTTVKAGSSVVAYKVSGADLAEVYYTTDNSVQPGDVVSVDGLLNAGVKKSSKAYDSGTLGIVSTKPGQVLGDDSLVNAAGRPVILALSGRVPVNVSMENGPIKAGDYLTASSTPGYAMKATEPGQMIGKALEDFSVNDPNGKGKVMTFANLTYANPNTGVSGNGNVQGSTMNASDMNVSGTTATQNLSVAGTATVKNLIVGTMTTTKELNVTGNATFGGDINLSGVGQSRNAITKKFKASKPIAIGSVVIADPDNDGQVTTTITPNDTRVLGIALTAAQQSGDEITVAIGGSVQVRTVTGATIQGGDLLTSSGEEGVAEKSSAPTPGSLLGKALGKPIDDMTWLLITLN